MPGAEPENLFIDQSQQTKLFNKTLQAINQVRVAADVLIATPLRIWDVFGKDSFVSMVANSAHHSILSPLTAAFTLIGALPFIAKVFVKDHTNNLGEIIKNLKTDYAIDFDINNEAERKRLEIKFNTSLKKRGIYHLQAYIKEDEKGKISLKLKYADSIADYFSKHWNEIKDLNINTLVQYVLKDTQDDPMHSLYASRKHHREVLRELDEDVVREPHGRISQGVYKNLFSDQDKFDCIDNILKDKDGAKEGDILAALHLLKMHPELIKKIQDNPHLNAKQKQALLFLSNIYTCFLNQEGQVDPQLTLALSRANLIKKINTISLTPEHAYDLINDYTYNFWISFFCLDVLEGNDNMADWSYENQVIVLGTAAGITLLQATLKIADYYANRADPDITKPPLTNNVYFDKPLKQSLLREFFIETIYAKKIKAAKRTSTQAISFEAVEDILNNKISPSTKLLKCEKQIQFLKDTYDPEKSKAGKRCLTVISNGVNQSILVSFIGWVVGAACTTAGMFGGASTIGALAAGAVLLSNPVGVAIFALGFFLGATWFASRNIQKDKEEEKRKWQQLENNKEKIDRLMMLEHQNKALRGLLKEKGIERLTIAKVHDDRLFRRFTNQKNTVFTKIKQFAAHAFTGIGSMGTGILIVRLTVLPILASTAAAVATGPVGLGVALGIGLIWAGITIYKYYQDRKREKCQRLLDDIDNRLQLAEKNQEIYKQQLGYKPQLLSEKQPTPPKTMPPENEHQYQTTPPMAIPVVEEGKNKAAAVNDKVIPGPPAPSYSMSVYFKHKLGFYGNRNDDEENLDEMEKLIQNYSGYDRV